MKQFAVGALTAGLLAGSILFSAQEKLAPRLVVEPQATNPWTHLAMNSSPQRVQFAIVSDRTGGHRALVFEKAVRKLQALQPEFVISVGDLIEGYTEKPEQLSREWLEFDSFVKRLSMPFFFVPGNHDFSNRLMEQAWQQRFGSAYYHFLYKDVLFLILNSEAQPGSKEPRLGEAQLAYCEKVLAGHPQPRWTFLFLHRPLWSYGPDKLGAGTDWPQLETLLRGREFTAFCGHHHRYQTWTRSGHQYIQLATTGGSSQMKGKPAGEFDEVGWVTVPEKGAPLFTNILLDGVVDFDLTADLGYDQKMAKAQEVQRAERERQRRERKAKESQRKAKAAAK